MTSFMMMGCIIVLVVEHLFISLQLSSAPAVAGLLSLRVSLEPLTALYASFFSISYYILLSSNARGPKLDSECGLYVLPCHKCTWEILRYQIWDL